MSNSKSNKTKPDWRHAETLSASAVVHGMHVTLDMYCGLDWDHSKEAWSVRLREVWLRQAGV